MVIIDLVDESEVMMELPEYRFRFSSSIQITCTRSHLVFPVLGLLGIYIGRKTMNWVWDIVSLAFGILTFLSAF